MPIILTVLWQLHQRSNYLNRLEVNFHSNSSKVYTHYLHIIMNMSSQHPMRELSPSVQRARKWNAKRFNGFPKVISLSYQFRFQLSIHLESMLLTTISKHIYMTFDVSINFWKKKLKHMTIKQAWVSVLLICSEMLRWPEDHTDWSGNPLHSSLMSIKMDKQSRM